MKWADYCVTKLSKNDIGFIDSVTFYEDLGDELCGNIIERNRNWMVRKVLLTKDEVQIAFDYLFDEYGKSVQLWEKDRQEQEISNYWIDRGKEILN